MLGLLYAIFAIFTKGKLKLGLGISVIVFMITLQVILGALNSNCLSSFYYYLYFMFPTLFIVLSISAFKNETILTPKNTEKEEA